MQIRATVQNRQMVQCVGVSSARIDSATFTYGCMLAGIAGALIAPVTKHYAAITDPVKLGGLLRAIEGFEGSPVTLQALRIAPHVFVRPGELRHAMWEEIDFEKAVWKIPEGRMKSRRPVRASSNTRRTPSASRKFSGALTRRTAVGRSVRKLSPVCQGGGADADPVRAAESAFTYISRDEYGR